MKRNLVLVALVAALVASLVTWQLKDTAEPQYVGAQSGQYVSLTFAPVVQKALPAVVGVVSEVRATNTRERGQRNTPRNLPPGFEDFFDFFGGSPFGGPEPPRRGGGQGSGVIVTDDGYILTNNHVVEGATSVKVVLGDRREMDAKVVGTDPRTDLAVLKINSSGRLPMLRISDSGKVQVGDVALAIGNPFGLSQTVTMGIVSATGRREGLTPGNYEDFIQTDAAINPGNSGGALINSAGDLIGINTAILSRSGGNQGIGFAIPANMARAVMDQLVKTGKVVRGYMGAGIQDITPDLARAFKLESPRGAAITQVEAGSPASQAGLQRGDVVTAINGQQVEDASQLRLLVSQNAPGTAITLDVVRDGQPRQIKVTLTSLPETGGPTSEGSGPLEGGTESALSGVTVDQLTPEIRQSLRLDSEVEGVVVTQVEPGSGASEAGLRRGDVILQVDRKDVKTVREFEQALPKGKTPVLLLVSRGGGTIFLVVEPNN
jgi:serine protease Do